MRMNRLVAGRVAAGLARYIAASDPAAAADGVVIGYDGRAKSDVFATESPGSCPGPASACRCCRGRCRLPALAFAVRYLHAAYGVMVTASHNPVQDNGIKVYVRDGGQLLPPADADIASSIDAVDPLRLPEGWAEGPFECASADDAVSAYVAAVASGGRRWWPTGRLPRPGPLTAADRPPGGAEGRAHRAARRG